MNASRPPVWILPCGLLSGLVSGLLGVGGGLVVSPMLLLSGLPLRKATGTALAVIPLVALMAVVADLVTLPGNLRVWLGLAVALGGPVGVQIGRFLEERLPSKTLGTLFQLLLVLTAIRSLGLWGELPSEALPGLASESFWLQQGMAVLLGIAAGICSVLFGVGGGVVVVPGLIFLVGGIDFRAATAASLLAMVPTTLFSLRAAIAGGRVEKIYVPRLLLGAIPAAALAVWMRNTWMKPQILSVLFGAFLLFVAAKMWMNRATTSDSDPRSPRKS